MKIEEEIKQKSFKNEFHKLVINLKFTAGWLGGIHNKIFKSYGISSQQYNVLRILRGQYPKPSSLILIRERMLDKESNASRLIDKLESSGYSKRVQCPNDRRQVDITITDQGRRLLDEIDPEVDHITSQIFNINEGEAKLMNKLLDKLRNGFENNKEKNLIENAERSN
jgi:DNA-binding MarR family transcriptional regulator